MITEIMSSLIASVLINGSKRLGAKMFREEDIRDWMSSSDFAGFVDEKICFEAPPEPAPDLATLTEFFSSEVVPLIVQQVFEQNEQSLSKLEEDFVEAFEDYTAASETLNPEFAHWSFKVLISAFKSFLSAKARDGNPIVNEYLRIVRRKEEMEEHREIKVGMEVVKESITEFQRPIESSTGGQIQKFIRWQEYFSRVEQHLMPLDTGPRLKQTGYYLNIVKEFLADNHNKILVLHAPGGSGKSHLLRQIAFDLEERHPEYIILSVTPGYPNLESALPGELDGDRRYLLLFDDADRWHKEFAPLFAYVKYQSSNVKIILTTRTAGLRGIQTVLNEQFCQDLTEEIRIGKWGPDDLRELLRFVLGGRHHNKEGLIVSMLPNPYLIVWAGNVINGDPGITVERLRRKFADDLEFETTRSLIPEFDKGRVGELLAGLALIGPFRRNDRAVLSLLKGKFGLTEETIQAQIDQMVKNGVLREVGYSTRFNPDMKGDLYLAHYIDQIRNSDALSKWIESWGPHFNDKILTNLEAASRFCEGDIVKDYFVSWIRKAIAESKDLSGYHRTECLEALSQFCYLVPEESIDLMYTYIDTPPPGDEDDAILSPTQDTYGTVVIRLIHAGFSREEIFDLLEHIYKNVPSGQYSNYMVESMVTETVSPFYNTLDKIRETLTLLESRLDAENEFSIVALGKALSEALRADHEISYLSSPYTITRDVRPLPATPAVLETREHAISILKRVLCHQSVHVRRKAVETSGKIGSKFGDGEFSLSERIAEERRIILAELEQLIPRETDYGVLCNIESLLFRWWEYKVSGTEDAESILKAFPRPMEYIIYGFLFYSRPLLLSFNPETIPSGEEERRKWCSGVKLGFAIPENIFTEFSEPILSFLSTTYPDASSVITLLQDLQAYQEHANINYHLLDSLLSAWIAKDPDIFFELRDREHTWSELPIGFKNAIDLGLCTHDPEQLDSFAGEVLVASQHVDSRRIERFIWLMTRYPPDEARVRDWLTKLIDTGEREIHLTLLYNLWLFSSRLENYEICVTSYLDILSYYETMDEKLLDLIATYVLHDLKENEDRLDSHQKESIKSCFKEKLIATSSLGNGPEHHVQTLINYILTEKEDILDFIRQRAERKRNARNYQILPLNGVSFLMNVKECAELEPILDELFTLMNERLIYREQLSVQLRSIASLKHQVSGKLCLEEYAEHLLGGGKVNDALFLCSVLLSQPGTEGTILKILGDAIAAGKRDDLRRLFGGYIRYDVITFMGGHSPELERKKEAISRLLSFAPPGSLRAVLREALQGVDAEIQSVKMEYEEDLVER